MDRFATHDGLRIAYDMAGTGRPLLIIGGLSADRLFWGLSRPLLANHTTLCFDNRDIGASSRAGGPYTAADMAQDALAVMDAAGWDSADILGHSLGGAIAQELALRAPERVHRLVLANTFARQDGYSREIITLLKKLRREITDPVTYVSTLATFTLGRAAIAAAPLEVIARMALAAGPLQELDAFERQADASTRVATLDRLPGLRCPTLVISSPDDRFFAPAFAQEIADAIAGATLTHIPSGHCPMIEAPDVFARTVRDFLA